MTSGVKWPVSPKSYANLPFVRLGQLAGSTATILVLLSPLKFLPINGKEIPAKFDPPPVHPTTMSGSSPAISNCFIASWPIID